MLYLTAGIGKEGGRNDPAHVGFGKSEFGADGTVGDRQVVSAHVEGRVEKADEAPVLTTSLPETRRLRGVHGAQNEELRRSVQAVIADLLAMIMPDKSSLRS